VELPFRIKFLQSRKLKGYEFPAISKQQNVKKAIMATRHFIAINPNYAAL
jgi:hypothetical protein